VSITGDGVVTIFARDQASFEQAKKMVEASVGKEVEVGGTYTARVVAIKDFGAFMELNGGYQGLLHISEIAHERIERVSDYLAVGQELGVVCIGRDLRGNLKLSRKMTLPTPVPPVAEAPVPEAASSGSKETNQNLTES
jgi:polyribonucleotide nucleotidyltransferase